MKQLENYRAEFQKCSTQKEYEEYYYKYYSTKDNPYTIRAKEIINQKRKIKSEYPIGFSITLSIVFLGMAIGIIILAGVTAKDSAERTASLIIAGVVCSPMLYCSVWYIIKSIYIHITNK